MKITKWNVETNPLHIRRLGKLCEELGEAQAVAARCIIQGIDEVDPSSGLTNRVRLEDEISDVMAQVMCSIETFKLDEARMIQRAEKKVDSMAEWERLVAEG